MRAALVGLIFCCLAGASFAGGLEGRIRAQLGAQGYEQIQFARDGDRLTVQARRGKLAVETVYDVDSGRIVSDRVRQADGDGSARDRSARNRKPSETARSGGGHRASAAAATSGREGGRADTARSDDRSRGGGGKAGGNGDGRGDKGHDDRDKGRN